MRVAVMTILVALAPAAAAASGFREHLAGYLAGNGGCGGSRALLEREFAAFERARAEGGAAPLLLFGKPAGAWSGEDVRELLAVVRACEAARLAPGRTAEENERRLAERLEQIARALRRAIALSGPQADAVEASALSAVGSGHRAGRLRQGPAFVAMAAGAPAGGAPYEATRPDARTADPARAPSAEAPPQAVPPDAQAPGADRESGRDGARSPGAPGKDATLLRAAARTVPEAAATQSCTLTMARFEQISANMSPAEAEALFGCRGRIDSATAIPGLGIFEIYIWSPDGQAGSVTLTFQNRRLKAKRQRGLG